MVFDELNVSTRFFELLGFNFLPSVSVTLSSSMLNTFLSVECNQYVKLPKNI